MIIEYDRVILKHDIPTSHLNSGAKGTVLLIYNELHLPRAYEVEFLDDEGNTIALITLTENDIEKTEL